MWERILQSERNPDFEATLEGTNGSQNIVIWFIFWNYFCKYKCKHSDFGQECSILNVEKSETNW